MCGKASRSINSGWIYLAQHSCVGLRNSPSRKIPTSLGKSGWPLLTLSNLWFYLALFFGLSAFVFFVLLVSDIRSRFLWYSLIAYWVVLFVYFVWVYYPYYWLFELHPPFYISLLLLTPFVYIVGSLIYFLTKKPREYFSMKK